jgi:hypothetical protein
MTFRERGDHATVLCPGMISMHDLFVFKQTGGADPVRTVRSNSLGVKTVGLWWATMS